MLSSGPPGDRQSIFNEIHVRAADGIHSIITSVHNNIVHGEFGGRVITMRSQLLD